MTEMEDVTALLIKTARAHHAVFKDLHGQTREWAPWYAQKMHAEFESILGRQVGVDGLADLLERFDELHTEEAPEERWPEYYARKLLAFYTG